MRYFDRRLLFPVAAATAFAQQQSPEAAATEAALRSRAQEFFQLQVDKKYRQAESMVADDTKDTYYNSNKFNIKSFSIQSIDLLDNNTRARVTIKAKVTLVLAGTGKMMDFDAPSITTWKLEKDAWVYYVAPAEAVQTPFGNISGGNQPTAGSPHLSKDGEAPDITTLQSKVHLAPDYVRLGPASPMQEVVVSNDLGGPVELSLTGDHLEGLKVELPEAPIPAGGKARVVLRVEEGKQPRTQTVRIIAAPLNTELNIRVNP